MINLLAADQDFLRGLAKTLIEEGMAVIRDVKLPDTFSPPATDIVFLRHAGEIEIYMSAVNCYLGTARVWQNITARSPSAGRTRLIATAPENFSEAFRTLRELLVAAGGRMQAEGRTGEPANVSPGPLDEPSSPRNPIMGAAPGVLERFGRDLTREAVEGKLYAPIGRQAEMLHLVRTLNRATKNTPVLIGEPGVGKTAIVEGLAWRIAHDQVPAVMRHRRLVQLHTADLVADSKYRGEFEARVQGLVRELTDAPDVILFIDELHTLIGAGRAEGMALDAANILKPALASGTIRCIGATTIQEYRQYIEQDAALERRLQPITINEPSLTESEEILLGVRQRLAQQNDVLVPDETCRAAVAWSARYLPHRRLPDKAIDVLDEACAVVRINDVDGTADQLPARDTLVVKPTHIAQVIAKWTGIPFPHINLDDRERVLDLGAALGQRIVGQNLAVTGLTVALQRAYAGLKPSGRPIAVLLFIGPPGVGKSQLAKATAEVLFASERMLTRLDMSEFIEAHSVAKLIGAPPGYIGHNEPGQLAESLRRKPFSVVLFDEIDKAHPDVLNVLLQVFDEGRLTDAKGQIVDASNALFIMTANYAAEGAVGFTARSQETEQIFLEDLKRKLRPEFINRIDQIIVFNPLEVDTLTRIAQQFIAGLDRRLTEKGIKLDASQETIQWLAQRAYQEHAGARPVRRLIEQNIENVVSGMILSGTAQKGQTVRLDVNAGSITFRVV